MKIKELLENSNFDDSKFVKKTDDSREIDYDLCDDLIYFMHNNDDVYRKYLYPVLIKCSSMLKTNKDCKPVIFKDAVCNCYAIYKKNYPIRELPNKLSSQLCYQICCKLIEDVNKNKEDL